MEWATAGFGNKLFVSRYLVALPSVEKLERFSEEDGIRLHDAKKLLNGSVPTS